MPPPNETDVFQDWRNIADKMVDAFQEIIDAEEIDDDKLNGTLESAVEVLRIAREMRPPAEPPRVLSPTSFHQTWEEGCIEAMKALADIRSGQVLPAERLQVINNILNIAQHNSPYVADADADEGEDDEPEPQNEIQPASPIQQTEIQPASPIQQNEIQPASPIHQPETQDDADPATVAMEQMTLSPSRQEPPIQPDEAPPSNERQHYQRPRWFEEGEYGYVPPNERVFHNTLVKKQVLKGRGEVFHHPRFLDTKPFRDKTIHPSIFDPNNPEHFAEDPIGFPFEGIKYSLKGFGDIKTNALYDHMMRTRRYLFFLSKDDCPELDADKGQRKFCGCSLGDANGYNIYQSFKQHIMTSPLHNPTPAGDSFREERREHAMIQRRNAQSSS